jgi:hypothetical protein
LISKHEPRMCLRKSNDTLQHAYGRATWKILVSTVFIIVLNDLHRFFENYRLKFLFGVLNVFLREVRTKFASYICTLSLSRLQ